VSKVLGFGFNFGLAPYTMLRANLSSKRRHVCSRVGKTPELKSGVKKSLVDSNKNTQMSKLTL